MRKRPMEYILDKTGKPVREPDLMKWARWYDAADRRVADDFVGDLWVSTVFLGLDHSRDDGPPILWETMVFDKEQKEKDVDRCSGSREQAEAMHALMVRKLERKFERKS
jgi:hypothetical protein